MFLETIVDRCIAMFRRRVFDLRILLSRSLSYACSLVVLAISFFGTEFLIEKFVYNNDEIVDIICAISGAFVFYFLRSFFNTITDRIFFRKEYNYATAVHDIGPLLTATIDLKSLLQTIYIFLSQTIKPDHAIFIFAELSSPLFFPTEQKHTRDEEDYSDLLNHATAHIKDPIFIHQLGYEKYDEQLRGSARSLDIAAIIPLASHDEPRAMLLLGPRLSGNPYRAKDILLIGSLSQQAGMAIRNARLYEEVRQYNQALEMKVEERTEKIRSMYESQSKFLTEVSHDLQTPMAILRGNVELMEHAGKRERTNALRVIGTTVNDMSHMVSNLLESARLKFSKNIFYKTEVSVRVLLQETYEDCLVLAEDKGIRFSWTSEEIWICSDRNKLKEVLLNLISNALKHTPRGGLIVIAGDTHEEALRIVVSDTGTGISPIDLPHIFERFYKIETAENHTPDSTGIGLDICRQIIEAHAGTITVESEYGAGSCFIIHLPILL